MPAQCCIDRWNRLMKENPDEPVFTLLGRDKLAVQTVKYWLSMARVSGVNQGKLIRVQEHLDALERFAREHPERMKYPD